ncbi:unnamed protein product [Owenia fusiformis]|uniref:Uncharacterized protein n=1 Tax=Owenia fusiformis TaxID=6347 RepID=A0A8J1Y7M6_OWEFU|nr:unnamed protein product [Owenia fusiformis]
MAAPQIRKRDEREAAFWNALNDMRVNGKLCDILLSVTRNDGSDVEYPAHKVILAASSRYFAANLDVLASVTIHKLSDITELGLKAVLDVIYRQEIPKLIFESTEVKQAADKLKIMLPEQYNPYTVEQKMNEPAMPIYAELALGLIQSYERSGLGGQEDQVQVAMNNIPNSMNNLVNTSVNIPQVPNTMNIQNVPNMVTGFTNTQQQPPPQNPSFSPSMYSEPTWRPDVSVSAPPDPHSQTPQDLAAYRDVSHHASVLGHENILSAESMASIHKEMSAMTNSKNKLPITFLRDEIPDGSKRKPLDHLDLAISTVSRAKRREKMKKRKTYKDPFVSASESEDEMYHKFMVTRSGDIRPAKTKHRAHGRKTKEKCAICDKTYNQANILRHIWRVHQMGEKPAKRFRHRAGRLDPGKSNKKRMKVSCNICGIIISQACMKSHIARTHDKIKRHSCTRCGKSFYDLKNLRMHVDTVHEGKRPFICDICGKAMARSHALQVHLGIQHGLKFDKYKELQSKNQLTDIIAKWESSQGGKSQVSSVRSRPLKNQINRPVKMMPPNQMANNIQSTSQSNTPTPIEQQVVHPVQLQQLQQQQQPQLLPSNNQQQQQQQPMASMWPSLQSPPLVSNNPMGVQDQHYQNLLGPATQSWPQFNNQLQGAVTAPTSVPQSLPQAKPHPTPPQTQTRYGCNICGETYATNGSLTRHIARVHNGSKKFTCTFCGKKCFDSTGLKLHIAVHTGEKNQVCPVCSYRCIQKAQLLSHIRRVHDTDKKKPAKFILDPEAANTYYCRLCEFSSKYKGNLKMHMQRRHGEGTTNEQILCTDCGKAFRFKDDLQKHVERVHLKVKKFQCEGCSKLCYDKQDLVRHKCKGNRPQSNVHVITNSADIVPSVQSQPNPQPMHMQ